MIMYRKDKKEEYYTLRARREGYPARSVYKLKDIDEKFRIIRNGDKVLDLGSAPGSWLIYISQKVGENGKVVGVDIQDLASSVKNTIFIKKSIFDFQESDLLAVGCYEKFNSVLADLSPNTTGIKSMDAGRSLEMSEKAFQIARNVLAKNGSFVCKIFQGEGMDGFLREVALRFKVFKRVRPKAVVKRSKEFYIVAKGFKENEIRTGN